MPFGLDAHCLDHIVGPDGREAQVAARLAGKSGDPVDLANGEARFIQCLAHGVEGEQQRVAGGADGDFGLADPGDIGFATHGSGNFLEEGIEDAVLFLEQDADGIVVMHGIDRAIDDVGGQDHPGRIVEPQDVADLIAFLCSPHARMILGQVIMIDGGWSIDVGRQWAS